MDINASSMSESLAVSLVHEWEILIKTKIIVIKTKIYAGKD